MEKQSELLAKATQILWLIKLKKTVLKDVEYILSHPNVLSYTSRIELEEKAEWHKKVIDRLANYYNSTIINLLGYSLSNFHQTQTA